jgi:tryptophan 2,3-dioxygenase
VTDPAVTYARYLKIDELLALQQPRSPGPEHDELLFIVIHQVYELWFKELCTSSIAFATGSKTTNRTGRSTH